MSVLIHPVSTEKSVGKVDRDNVITYVVDFRATKTEIAKEFAERFNVKVANVRTINMPDNKKKALIKLDKGSKASEVAVKLKLV